MKNSEIKLIKIRGRRDFQTELNSEHMRQWVCHHKSYGMFRTIGERVCPERHTG